MQQEGKKAHVIQHVATEGVGWIGGWLRKHNYDVTYTGVAEERIDIDLSSTSIDLLMAVGWIPIRKKSIPGWWRRNSF